MDNKISKELINWFKEATQKHDSLRKNVAETYWSAMMELVTQRRSLIIHISTISAGIVGFSIPVLNNNNIVAFPILYACGIFCLIMLLMYGLLYLAFNIENGLNSLDLQQSQFNTMLDEQRDARLTFMREQTKSSLEQYNRINNKWAKEMGKKKKAGENRKKDYAIDIIAGLFFLGISFMILSVILPFY